MRMKVTKEKLQAAVDFFKSVHYELKMVFQKDGIHMWAYDDSHDVMLLLVLKKEACAEYDPSNDGSGSLEIVMDLEKLKDYLKLYKNKDELFFTYDPESNRLVAYNDNLTRTFGLIDPDGYPNFKLPELSLKKMVQLKAEQFLSGIDRVMADREPKKKRHCTRNTVSLSVTPQGLTIGHYYEDGRTEKTEENIPRDLLVAFSFDDEKASLYDYDILYPLVKALKKYAPMVTVEFDRNNPIRINGDSECFKVLYLQVSRVIRDEETDLKTEIVPQKEDRESMPITVNEDIGWLASPKNDSHLVGEVIRVTDHTYILLFRGSKQPMEPVEYERELVTVYRRNNKTGGKKNESE